MTRFLTVIAVASCLLPVRVVDASVISVNFHIGTDDDNSVDSDESAVVLSDGRNVSGQYWNQPVLLDTGVGSPTTFIAATQGGNSLTLVDDVGSAAGSLSSSGSPFWSSFSDATDGSNCSVTGEAGLMQSLLLLWRSETVTISGLGSDFTGGGYDVLLFCELGSYTVTRNMRLLVVEGPGGNDVNQVAWYRHSSAGIDGDQDDDGYMEWVRATGASSSTPTPNGNYVLVENLAADSFTIYGNTTGNRSALSGLQIIADQGIIPEPATLLIWVLGPLGLAFYGWRKKRAV